MLSYSEECDAQNLSISLRYVDTYNHFIDDIDINIPLCYEGNRDFID